MEQDELIEYLTKLCKDTGVTVITVERLNALSAAVNEGDQEALELLLATRDEDIDLSDAPDRGAALQAARALQRYNAAQVEQISALLEGSGGYEIPAKGTLAYLLDMSSQCAQTLARAEADQAQADLLDMSSQCAQALLKLDTAISYREALEVSHNLILKDHAAQCQQLEDLRADLAAERANVANINKANQALAQRLLDMTGRATSAEQAVQDAAEEVQRTAAIKGRES
jgi:hypothetical protein